MPDGRGMNILNYSTCCAFPWPRQAKAEKTVIVRGPRKTLLKTGTLKRKRWHILEALVGTPLRPPCLDVAVSHQCGADKSINRQGW